MTKLTPEQNFRAVAPRYMALLLADFPTLGELDAAAVFGNAGHESLGLTVDQEIGQKAPRGGLNWFQWTGPRRRAFEAYCVRSGKDKNSDAAAYAYLFVELKGPEKRSIPALRKAKTLDEKVVAFELAFERAGVKHYPSRKKWAAIALDAYRKAQKKPVQPRVAAPAPDAPASGSNAVPGNPAVIAVPSATIPRMAPFPPTPIPQEIPVDVFNASSDDKPKPSLLSNITTAWIVRRLMEVGGIVTAITTLYVNLPPGAQRAIGDLFTGKFEQVSVGAVIGLGVYFWSQIWSFRSTVKPQVITAAGTQVPMKPMPKADQKAIEAVAAKSLTASA